LAFLVLDAGRWFGREELAEALWPDHPPADPLKAVRHEIWCLKSALRAYGRGADEMLAANGHAVSLRHVPDLACDVHLFQDSLPANGSAAEENRVAELETAIDLYAGDLMPGIDSRWCLWRRRALRDSYLCALESLAEVHEKAGRWDPAIAALNKLIAADPLVESAHRALMRCYHAKGDRARALRQYELCREALADAFDGSVEPMTDTWKLRAAIRGDATAIAVSVPWPSKRPGSVEAIRRPSQADNDGLLSDLTSLRDDLRSIGGRIDHLVALLSKT